MGMIAMPAKLSAAALAAEEAYYANQNRNGRTGTAMTATAEETTTTRGRKPLCGHDLGNGAKCELDKGHDPKMQHTTIDITDDDLEAEFIPADEVPTVVKSTAVRPPEQLKVDDAVEKNYQEWRSAGSHADAPIWSRFTVAPHKAKKMRSMLRNAADNRKAGPVQLRLGDNKFVKVGTGKEAVMKTQIPFAILDRRKYEKKS